LLLSDIDDIGDTLRDYFEAFVEYNTTAAKEKVDEISKLRQLLQL